MSPAPAPTLQTTHLISLSASWWCMKLTECSLLQRSMFQRWAETMWCSELLLTLLFIIKGDRSFFLFLVWHVLPFYHHVCRDFTPVTSHGHTSLILCDCSSLRCQLPVERLGTAGHLGHDELLRGHPLHLHVSVRGQAVPRHSRYLVLRPALPAALPSGSLQNAHGRRARELQGPHQAAGRPAPEELHSAHQQHRHRALGEILLPRWPRWSQHVHVPRLRWAQSSW